MVRILCEGKGDRDFLMSLLGYLGIEATGNNFIIMRGKSPFFKQDHSKYKRLDSLINIGEIDRLLFILDADADSTDRRYNGHENTVREINHIIDLKSWADKSEVYIACDPVSKTGCLESLIYASLPEEQQKCIDDFIQCSHFTAGNKCKHKPIIRQIFKWGYPNHPYNFNHENFSALKTKLQTLFTTED